MIITTIFSHSVAFYTCLDVDLKGVTPYKTLKVESTHKNHNNDNYSAFHIRDARSPFAFQFLNAPCRRSSLYNSFCMDSVVSTPR